MPVPKGTTGDETVAVGVLPAGRYASLVHVGHYDELVAAHAALQAWARDNGVTFDSWPADDGEVWRSRVEHYVTNPADEPDPRRWRVDIAYLTTG